VRIQGVTIDGELSEFGGRALIVRTDRGELRTPQRALTSSEIQYKAKLPSEPPIDNELSEMVSFFTEDQWEDFLKKNGSFASRLSRLEFFGDKMGYTLRRVFPKLPKTAVIDKDSVKYLLELQRNSPLDFIMMPSLPPEERRFSELAVAFSEEVISEHREPMVYLDMGLEASLFKTRFDELLELARTGLVNTIGLLYRPVKDTSVNYLHLWRNRESKVLLQMSDVPRTFKGTSTMHLLQKWGIDAFSVRLNRFQGGGRGDGSKPRREFAVSQVKRLDHRPLVFKSFDSWVRHGDDLGCGCPVCKDLTVPAFVERYRDENEAYDGEVFNAATRLHEYFKSSDEFKAGRARIREGELAEYFQQKEGLRDSDEPIPRPVRTLNGWSY
jgi:hypothetical protein